MLHPLNEDQQNLLLEFKNSGLTMKEFVSRKGINYNSLAYLVWKEKRLNECSSFSLNSFIPIKSDKTKIGTKSISGQVIKILEKAFYLEKKYKENNLSPIDIQKRRKEEVKPIIDEFFKFIKEIHPSSGYPIKNAIEYSLNYEKYLYTFIDNGYIPMTNNLAERGIKPFVINRKNFLFSYTEKGALASALLMSITQTAKNILLQVDKYIEYVLSKLQTTKQSEIESLLPYIDKLPDEVKIKIE